MAELGLVRPEGHEGIVRGLVRSSRDGRLPHALLLSGEEGTGRFRAALWLAAALLCEGEGDEPCLECGSCKRVRTGQHADVFVVDHVAHNQNGITIHFVTPRDPRPKDAYQGPPIEEFLALRAAEGRGKFVIVRSAEHMNEEAQNAFLKMLEEPRPGVHLLLECSSPGGLLATVRSRVVPIAFEPLDRDLTERIVRREGGFTEGDADDAAAVELLVRLAQGSPGRALELRARGVPEMLGILGAAFAGGLSVNEAVAELWEVDGDFPGKTKAAERRTRARAILDLGIDLLVDIERCVAGADPAGLPHGEAAAAVVAPEGGPAGGPAGGAAGRWQRPDARRRIGEAWLAARSDLNLNLSPEGLVERALMATVEARRTARR